MKTAEKIEARRKNGRQKLMKKENIHNRQINEGEGRRQAWKQGIERINKRETKEWSSEKGNKERN